MDEHKDCKKKEKYKLNLVIVLIATSIAILSYFWKPESRFDLKVIYDITNYFTLLDFEGSILYLLSRGEYFTMTYLYAMSFIDNLSFVQVLPVFMFVFFISNYLKESINFPVEKKNPRWVLLSLGLLLSRLSLLYVFSSFRFWVAFSLFLYLIGKKDRKYYLFLPALIHNSMLLFLLVYWLTRFELKKTVLIVTTSFLVLIGTAKFFKDILILNGRQGIVNELLRKLVLYFQIDIQISKQYLFLIFEILIYCGVLYLFNRIVKNKEYTNAEKLTFLLATLAVLTIGFKNLNFRVLEILRFLMFPINISLLEELFIKKRKLSLILIFLFVILIIGGLFIQISIYRYDILPNIRTGGYYVS